MANTALVLVDTSVWIQFFRTPNSREAKTLDELLLLGAVAVCEPIRAEVISGSPNKQEFQRLRKLFEALVFLAPPNDIWTRIEEHRFALARHGIQSALIDLWIALTAQFHQVALWTLDEDFPHITSVIPISLYHIEINSKRPK